MSLEPPLSGRGETHYFLAMDLLNPADEAAVADDPSAFAGLVDVATAVGASRSRLIKAERLAAYFARLADADLVRAARFIAGQPFPLWDARTVQVGPAALLRAVAHCSGKDLTQLQAQLVTVGDLGDLAGAVWPAGTASGPSLTDVEDGFAALAACAGRSARDALLLHLLQPLSGAQARLWVKLVAGELRIGLKEGAVEEALARASGADIAAVQWANMLLGDLGETALAARHQNLSQVRMRPLQPLKFMLASPVDGAESVAKAGVMPLVIEDKYDGIRAQIHLVWQPPLSTPAPEVSTLIDAPTLAAAHAIPAPLRGCLHADVRVAIFTRSLDDITPSFPDLLAPLAALVRQADGPRCLILDGEIVPALGSSIRPFTALQPRLGRRAPSRAIQAAAPVAFIAFDLLMEDAEICLNEAHQQRRRRLVAAMPVDPEGPVRCAPSHLLADLAQLDAQFLAARARNNEGLVLKDPASPYRPGRRGRDWFKLKRPQATLDVVITAAEVGHGRRRHWLSDYTFAVRRSADDPTLLTLGKAYSGLTDLEVEALTTWLRAHTRETVAHGRVCIVEPAVVLEVTFDRVQASARHQSGYALRFPRIVRRRFDKALADIDTLDTVKALAAGSLDPARIDSCNAS